MDWFKICSDYYKAEYYNNITLKVFVARGRIIANQYKTITGIDYAA